MTKQKIWRNYTFNISKIYTPKHKVSNTIKESKGETECRRFLETMFQKPFPKVRPDFLKNPVTGNNLEIDCYNQELKLGVEYNGKQHYEYNSYFHQNYNGSLNQKYRDELKRRMCRDNNITLIEVPYTIKISNISSYLYTRLQELGYI